MSEKNQICTAQSTDSASAALQTRLRAVYKPKYRSHYSENAWQVVVNLPGVAKDQLDVTVENEILEIRATRLLDTPDGWRPLAEYPSEKNYRLRLDVGPEVDASGISAHLEDGVLNLELPLRDEVKPRKIEVG